MLRFNTAEEGSEISGMEEIDGYAMGKSQRAAAGKEKALAEKEAGGPHSDRRPEVL